EELGRGPALADGVAEPAADEGAEEAGHDEEQPEPGRRLAEGEPALADEVRRHPRRQAAHGEGVEDLGDGVGYVARPGEERCDRRAEAERRPGRVALGVEAAAR